MVRNLHAGNPRARKRHRRDRETRRRRDAGAAPIPEGELRHFKGKLVRIFADADGPGLQAEGRWWHQLESAGAKVDGYSFEGFLRSDGKPVKDLNDFVLIDPDQWEAQRDAIEEAFAFSA